jgi:hypothetical protein
MEVISETLAVKREVMCNYVIERTPKDATGCRGRTVAKPTARAEHVIQRPWFRLEMGEHGGPVPTTSEGNKANTKYVPFRTPEKEPPKRAQPQSNTGCRHLDHNLDSPNSRTEAPLNLDALNTETREVRRRSARIAEMYAAKAVLNQLYSKL